MCETAFCGVLFRAAAETIVILSIPRFGSLHERDRIRVRQGV